MWVEDTWTDVTSPITPSRTRAIRAAWPGISMYGVVNLADGLPAHGMILGLLVVGEGLFVGAVPVSYRGYRYPAEVIAHCVWLYHRFPLSFREVEELMLARGVTVSYETIRQGGRRNRCGPSSTDPAGRRKILPRLPT